MKKILLKLLVLGALFSCSAASNASPEKNLPFNITPIFVPTQVIDGTPVIATYKVQNGSAQVRNDNHLDFDRLPPNVTQITSNPNIPNLCATAFKLNPRGAPGDSCTLALSIANAVTDGQIYVCYKGNASCTRPALLNVALFSCPTPLNFLVGVGRFNNDTRAGYARSPDRGLTWISNLLDPAASVTGLASDSCACNQCVAVGFANTGLDLRPLIATTPDAGSTWTQQILSTGQPAGFSAGYLNGVSCIGNVCSAVGTYQETSTGNLHFGIANTTNGGQSWTQLALPFPGTPANITSGQLFGVSCYVSTNLCLAAGTYSNNTGQSFPEIATSTDRVNWTQVPVELPPPMPPVTGISGDLRSVACMSNGFCIAVGTIVFDVPDEKAVSPMIVKLPLTKTSATQEARFTSVNALNFNTSKFVHPIMNNIANPIIKNKDSQSSSLVQSIPFPGATISNDNGATWEIFSILGVEGVDPQPGQMFGISCAGDTCVATGFEFIVGTPNIQQVSFTFTPTTITRTVITNPPDLAGFGIFCSNNVCATASGQRSTIPPLVFQPAFARSTDFGISWFADLIATPGAENGFLAGMAGTAGA